MNKSVVSVFGTFTNDELNTLKNGLKELSDVMTMMDSQKEVKKDILNSLYEELKIPKKILRKMANVYHKRNYAEVVTEHEEFDLIYSGLVNDNE